MIVCAAIAGCIQVRDKPCKVVDIRVEPVAPDIEGPNGLPPTPKPLRLKQEILDRELERVYQAKTLKGEGQDFILQLLLLLGYHGIDWVFCLAPYVERPSGLSASPQCLRLKQDMLDRE